MNGERSRESLVAFVVREARLLDECRYEEWYDCYAPDGFYWVPLSRDQPDGVLHNSLAYEDKLLLKLRIQRLAHARAFSQQPASRCHHVLQVPEVECFEIDEGIFSTRTQMLYTESRLENLQHYSVTVWHRLRWMDSRWQVVLKRCDILNADAMLPSIQLFI
jgi:3-phenylpropionate/cinnamic acid dioxygenase small subunit